MSDDRSRGFVALRTFGIGLLLGGAVTMCVVLLVGQGSGKSCSGGLSDREVGGVCGWSRGDLFPYETRLRSLQFCMFNEFLDRPSVVKRHEGRELLLRLLDVKLAMKQGGFTSEVQHGGEKKDIPVRTP